MKAVRKVLLGVFTIIITIASLITSTYAWFKINSSASVSGFDFRATGGEGFMVSLDNKNFTNDLTSTQIRQAILMGYDRERFVLEDGKLYENVGTAKQELNDSQISAYLNRYIELYPATSTDGINFYTMTGSKISSTKGMIVEFDVYFKAVATTKEGQRSNIYLLGENLTRDIDQREIKKTSIKSSEENNITLLADMKTINGDLHAATSQSSADQVKVYTSNSLRFSISDDLDTSKSNNTAYIKAGINEDKNLITLTGPKDSASINLTFDLTNTLIKEAIDTVNPDNKCFVMANGTGLQIVNTKTGSRVILNNIAISEGKADISTMTITKDAIYELSDDSEYDLGSYATDYRSESYIADGTLTDLDKLYNSEVNAMYTYYNNRRPYDTLTDRLLKYDSKPVTIRNLVTNSDIENGLNPHYIASVDAGSESVKLTFRFWLEGWDADCFDGISKAIKVNLSFTSQKEMIS